MKILIAEDDEVCRLVLVGALEALGHECITTVNGAHAWQLYLQCEPEVVISDWLMPGMSGLELVRSIRAQKTERYTFFLMLTALSSKQHLLEGLHAGADDYLPKPFNRAELQARLRSASRVTGLHQQLVEQNRELKRLNQVLFEDGRNDPLTRLGNRLRLQEDLALMVSRAERYGHSFALAMCDIDYFKKYNDTCGHAAGDEAIRVVARTLARCCRSGDVAYRYGGEEFLLLLPEQSLASASLALERCRGTIEALGIPHPGKNPVGVLTISAGISCFDPNRAPKIEVVAKEADEALYLAKQMGRNRVFTSDELVIARSKVA